MDYVKSFEESNQNVYGDLLTRKRTKPIFKVGLLLFGYFEYWRMFSDAFRDKVESNLKVVEQRLSNEYNVISSGLIDTMDSADMSGQILRDELIDVLVVVFGTYVPDYLSMHAINYVKDVPIIVFSVQESERICLTADYQECMRNSSAMGVSQITGTFSKIGRQYKVVVGSIHDESAYAKINRFLKAVHAIESIKEKNIGVVGNVFRGMYDLELSKTFLKGKFDVNVVYIQNSHLFDAWEQTSNQESQEVASLLMNRFKIRTVQEKDILRACHLAIAMRKMVERFRLDALCFLDQHYIQKLFHTSARIGASLLLEESAIPVCCEGDISGIVMTMLMQLLSGKNPMQGEWGQYDIEHNTFMIMGHGVGDSRLALSDQDVTLTVTPEDWGMESVGLNYEFIVKPGIYTIGHFLERMSGYSVFLSCVESLPHPTMTINDLHAYVKVNKPIKEYLEQAFAYGVAHHCILGEGDMIEELRLIADLLSLDQCIL